MGKILFGLKDIMHLLLISHAIKTTWAHKYSRNANGGDHWRRKIYCPPPPHFEQGQSERVKTRKVQAILLRSQLFLLQSIQLTCVFEHLWAAWSRNKLQYGPDEF